MAEQTYFIGSTGPFTYDDANFPAALQTTGVIRSDAVPASGSDVLRLDDLSSIVAPADAKYVVISLDDDLSEERVLAVNTTNLTLTDGGANGNVTLNTVQDINVSASPVFTGLTLSAIPTGVDNSVLVSVGGVLKTDEIDSRVWIGSLVSFSGSPREGHIPYFTAAAVITMDSGQLFWDASNNRLGIGTDSPDAPLSIEVSQASAYLTTFNLYNAGTTTEGHGSAIWFSHQKSAGKENSAAIFGLRGAGETDGDLQFKVRDNGAWVTAIHIDGADGGNVGIGTDSPLQLLHIEKAADPVIQITDTGNISGYISARSTGFTGLGIYWDTGELRFLTGNPTSATTRMTILANGNVGIGLQPTANMVGLSIEAGVLTIKETGTPTADTNYGKLYTKNTNKLFFQDGAGVEHELVYA